MLVYVGAGTWEYIGYGFAEYWFVPVVLLLGYFAAWAEGVRVKAILMAIALAVALSIAGCTSMILGNAFNQGRDLSPEQIDAIGKAGNVIFACVNLSGPPPSGSTVWIIVPKESGATVKFSEGCRILP